MDIKMNNGELWVVSSQAGVGKTSLQVMLASGNLNDGKRVLFVSAEANPKWVRDRFMKATGVESMNLTLSAPMKYNLESVVELIDSGRFQVVYIDDANMLRHHERFGPSFVLRTLSDCAIRNQCTIVTGVQEQRATDSGDSGGTQVFQSTHQIVDKVLSIKRKKLSLWERVKYSLLFWKKKPNRTISVTKNRRGKMTEHDVYIDFDKMKYSL